MTPQILLAQFRALLERAPNLEGFSPSSRGHQMWLAQAHALVARWKPLEAISFQSSCNLLSSALMRDSNITIIFGTIHRAIADLEIDVPAEVEVAFGAGEVYDFFKALNAVISSAEKSLFIIDPYLDESVFDHYLNKRQKDVEIRLLLSHKPTSLIPASQKYISQHGEVLKLKSSKNLHDRVIFVDGYVCWVIGQSVKDAAKAKPTYLVQLPPDVIPAKLENYEMIWASANEL